MHRSSMKFGMQLYYNNAPGSSQGFFKILNYSPLLAFLKNTLFLAGHEVIPTLLPHNSKTIGRSSMKFGMQLHPPPQKKYFIIFFLVLRL